MTPLDDLLALRASERRWRLRRDAVRDALRALGKEAGITWLEEHIESPIGPEWGDVLYAMEPEWTHLDRWIRLSKLHCLAAVDAILSFAPDPHFDDDGEAELPSGANPSLINDAMTYALEHFGNPRLQAAAKRVRHAWLVGKPPRNAVRIPAAIKKVATVLFGRKRALMKAWNEAMATALDAPKNADDYWQSLLEFGDRNDIVAIVDCRECSEEIVGRLRDLQSAEALPIPWETHEHHNGESESLFRKLNSTIAGSGRSLVSLDTGGDSYALVFVESEKIADLEHLIVSALAPDFRDSDV